MLFVSPLREKLRAGRSVLGTFCTLPSPHLMDVIGGSGLDFAVLDGEHGPLSFETAQLMTVALQARAVAPLVRVAGPNESDILRALDIGSAGIHVPNIRTAEDLESVIAFAKYEPRGRRGFSPFMRACGYSHANTQEYLASANERSLIAVHVEGQAGLNLLDRFLGTEEVDVLFVGLFDLTKSMGIAGQVDHPRVDEVLQSIGEKAKAAEKVWGTIVTSHVQTEKFRQYGMRYFTYSVDCEVIGRAYGEAALAFRRQFE